jgi:hypothetical protein
MPLGIDLGPVVRVNFFAITTLHQNKLLHPISQLRRMKLGRQNPVMSVGPESF